LAAERAQAGGVGTVGIQPTFPAIGYGYLHTSGQERVRTVQRFVEKPDRTRAQTFLDSGEYLWNAGIFVAQTETFLREVERFQPHLRAAVDRIAASWGQSDYDSVLQREFTAVTSISVDFGVMEKASDVWTVTSAFDWNDIGGWMAAIDLIPPDENGNRTRGAIFLDAARNNFVLSTDSHHPVLCVGLQDCVVVATPDGTLVCHRDRVEDLKPMVQKLLAEAPTRPVERPLHMVRP
jgi:mannose-1-phosphate guanylyltransferase